MAVSKVIKDRNTAERSLRDRHYKELKLKKITEAKKRSSATKTSLRDTSQIHPSGGIVTGLEYEELPRKKTYTAFDFSEKLQGNEYPGLVNSYISDDITAALHSASRSSADSGPEVTRMEYEGLPKKQTYTSHDLKEELQGNEYPGLVNSSISGDITTALHSASRSSPGSAPEVTRMEYEGLPQKQTYTSHDLVEGLQGNEYSGVLSRSADDGTAYTPGAPSSHALIMRDLHNPVRVKSSSFGKTMPVTGNEHIMHHPSKEGDIYYNNLIKILNKFNILESDTIDPYIYSKLKEYGVQISKNMQINSGRIKTLEKTLKKLKYSSQTDLHSNFIFMHHTHTDGQFPALVTNSSDDISEYIKKYDYRKKYKQRIKIYNPLLKKYSNLKNNGDVRAKIRAVLQLPAMTVITDKADSYDKMPDAPEKAVEASPVRNRINLIRHNTESIVKKPGKKNLSYDSLIRILESFGINVETHHEAHADLIRYTKKIGGDIRELRNKEVRLKKEIAALRTNTGIVSFKAGRDMTSNIFSYVDKPIRPLRRELKTNNEFRKKFIHLNKRIGNIKKNYEALKHEKSLTAIIKPRLQGILEKLPAADHQLIEEKRKSGRIRKRLPVSIFSNGLKCKGLVLDVSSTGMFIRTRKPFNPGVPVEISLKAAKDYIICVRGYSVRTANTGNFYISSGMGIQLASESQAYCNLLGL